MNLMTVLPKLNKRERYWLEQLTCVWLMPKEKRLTYPVTSQALMVVDRKRALEAAYEALKLDPKMPEEATLIKKLKEDYYDET